jgi:hypothetical protein
LRSSNNQVWSSVRPVPNGMGQDGFHTRGPNGNVSSFFIGG